MYLDAGVALRIVSTLAASNILVLPTNGFLTLETAPYHLAQNHQPYRTGQSARLCPWLGILGSWIHCGDLRCAVHPPVLALDRCSGWESSYLIGLFPLSLPLIYVLHFSHLYRVGGHSPYDRFGVTLALECCYFRCLVESGDLTRSDEFSASMLRYIGPYECSLVFACLTSKEHLFEYGNLTVTEGLVSLYTMVEGRLLIAQIKIT